MNNIYFASNIFAFYLCVLYPLGGGQLSLRWRHNERDCVSNHQPHYCLLKRLFGRRSKKTSKLRVTGLCEGNSPEAGEFTAQRASNAENVPIWWRHHDTVTNHLRLDSLLNRLFRQRSKKTSKLRVTGLCEGNSPVTGEFPTQRTSNAKNVSIWLRHRVTTPNQSRKKSMCILYVEWLTPRNYAAKYR